MFLSFYDYSPDVRRSGPSAASKVVHAGQAAGRIVRHVVTTHKTPFATEEHNSERADICKVCDYWSPNGNFRLGECWHKDCGCTKAKQGLVTETCPDGRWTEVDKKHLQTKNEKDRTA